MQEAVDVLCAAAESTLPKYPAPGTVRVRIAVVVSDQEYVGCCSCGDSYEDRDAMKDAYGKTVEGEIVAAAFIEADIPKLSTVQGRIVEARKVKNGRAEVKP